MQYINEYQFEDIIYSLNKVKYFMLLSFMNMDSFSLNIRTPLSQIHRKIFKDQ